MIASFETMYSTLVDVSGLIQDNYHYHRASGPLNAGPFNRRDIRQCLLPTMSLAPDRQPWQSFVTCIDPFLLWPGDRGWDFGTKITKSSGFQGLQSSWHRCFCAHLHTDTYHLWAGITLKRLNYWCLFNHWFCFQRAFRIPIQHQDKVCRTVHFPPKLLLCGIPT